MPIRGLLFVLALAPDASSQDALWERNGTAPGATTLGWSVANAGDVDGDGVADVAVGTSEGGFDSRLEVLSGVDGSVLFQASHVLRVRAAAAGDVNADGLADVVASSPAGFTVYGGPGGAVLFDVSDPFLGSAAAGIGDVNGDGHDDLALGGFANLAPGFVRVLSGADLAVLYEVPGDQAHDGFGGALASAADLDADGVPDFVAGGGTTGIAKAVSGSTGDVLFEVQGNAPLAALAALADLDGDGVGDFLAGSPLDDTAGADAGRVWLFSGVDGDVVATFDGAAPGQHLGASVAAAGDVDADGIADWIAGAPGDASAAPGAGAAQLRSGAAGVRLSTFTGSAAGDELGTAVAGRLDANADGHADVALGRPSVAGGSPGRVTLVAGHPLYLNATPRRPAVGTTLTLETARGQPFGPYGLLLLDVAGAPFDVTSPRVVHVGTLDAQGAASVSWPVAAILAGAALTLRSVAFDAGGRPVRSAEETVTIPWAGAPG